LERNIKFCVFDYFVGSLYVWLTAYKSGDLYIGIGSKNHNFDFNNNWHQIKNVSNIYEYMIQEDRYIKYRYIDSQLKSEVCAEKREFVIQIYIISDLITMDNNK